MACCYNKYNCATGTLLLLLISSLAISHQQAAALPDPACPKKCGDVDVSYPFGIGAGCAMAGFELDCARTADGRGGVMLSGRDYPVLGISLHDGIVRMKTDISYMNSSRGTVDYHTWQSNFTGSPFTFSEKLNMFTVVGVNTLAYMIRATHVIGCLSSVASGGNLTAQDGVCNGVGCCQAALTGNTSDYNVHFDHEYNNTKSYINRSATSHAEYFGYAVVMEAGAFRFRTAYLNSTAFWDESGGRVPVIMNWAVGNQTCDVARRNASSYACRSKNSGCVDSGNGPGYLCNCTQGYQGNPYLPSGCQGVAIMVILITCIYLIRERSKLADIRRKYFKQHGGMLLLEKISSEHGGGAFKIFTEAELEEATHKFDDGNVLGRGGQGTVYKGTLKGGLPIAVKRCLLMTDEEQKKEFGKEMLILSQINHKNIVKLLGCCLEVEIPMLVYEFVPNGTLFQLIHGGHAVPFSTRLRIAHESAQALDYLHSSASPPILHGDVKSCNILLGEGYAAKVSDFGASIVAPTDESQFVTVVQGTCGYLDPEYMQTCKLTDKSDVYSFGVVLLELITGKKAFNLEGPETERSLSLRFLCAVKEGMVIDVMEDRIRSDENAELLHEVANLARRCLEMTGERRPTMREVTQELDRLRKVTTTHPWAHHDQEPEQMQSLIWQLPMASFEMDSTGNFSADDSQVKTLLESGR